MIINAPTQSSTIQFLELFSHKIDLETEERLLLLVAHAGRTITEKMYQDPDEL